MNAREKGEQAALLARLAYPGVSRETFAKLAASRATRAYASAGKQQEFIEGFMARYVAPHAKDCTCVECSRVRADIVDW